MIDPLGALGNSMSSTRLSVLSATHARVVRSVNHGLFGAIWFRHVVVIDIADRADCVNDLTTRESCVRSRATAYHHLVGMGRRITAPFKLSIRSIDSVP